MKHSLSGSIAAKSFVEHYDGVLLEFEFKDFN